MTTHAKLGAQLLREAATFFDTVAEQNPTISERMNENAKVYRQVADLVEDNPTGTIDIATDGE